MNRRPCQHLGHYERNGTYLRVLLAVPAHHELNPTMPMNGSAEKDICIDTTRIVILTAPNLHALDEHTARLQTTAAEVDWELRPADGLHRRIIERIRQQKGRSRARPMRTRRHAHRETVPVEEQVANPLLRPGLRLPHHRSTTRHLASLYPCQIDPGLGPTGVLMGTDLGSGSTFHYDAFDLYARGIITSPNMVILGLVGRCKSTVVKTLLYRSLGLLASPNGQPRFAEIADPKRQIRTTRRRLGMTRLKLVPGGTTRLGNPSDPRRPRETPQQPHPTHDRPRRYAQPSSRSPPPDGSNNSSPSPNPPTYPADTK